MRHLLSFQPMPGMVDTPHKIYTAAGAGTSANRVTARSRQCQWMPMARSPI
jgi:hypothetical protein